MFLFGSLFVAKLTPPNEQSFKIKLELKCHYYVSNS